MPDDVLDLLPVPELIENPEIRPHIEGLRRNALVLPRCQHCGFVIWFPRVLCPACGSLDVKWIEIEGRGHVYSYTRVHRTTAAFAESVPFVIAYIELSCGPRILSNIVGSAERLAIGSEVVASYAGGDAAPILRFRLARVRSEGE
jgi:hypothetical protein